MKNKSFIFLIILLILYILSFVSEIKRNSPKPVKTALMNKKYEESLSSFNFTSGDTQLYFKKKNGVWFVNTKDIPALYVPADTQKVNSFIKDLTKVISLYKISDKKSANSSFQFENPNAITLNYENFSIFFGNYDFSQTYRYLTTSSSETVYQINTELDKYLTTSILAWSEPYIISRQFINISTDTIQSIEIHDLAGKFLKHKPSDDDYKDTVFALMELRNGGVLSDVDEQNLSSDFDRLSLSLKIECGDTSEIFINIYKTDYESEYVIKTEYKSAFDKNDNVIYEKISSWTYNRIKEIML